MTWLPFDGRELLPIAPTHKSRPSPRPCVPPAGGVHSYLHQNSPLEKKRTRTATAKDAPSLDVETGNSPSNPSTPSNERELVLRSSPPMCFHSFDVLIESLRYGQHHLDGKRKQTTPAFVSDLPNAAIECPVFVTWEKQRSSLSHWQLRGCIGTLGPRLLVDAIGEYALISALKDRRFDPVTIQEVPFLRVSVSLLVDYEVCQDVHDWTVGKHGIMIKFTVSGRSYSATYLPEVAKDQNWTIAQTVSSLVQKAGYHGTLTPEILRSIHCTRYQSSKCQVTYAQYVEEHCQGVDPLAVTTTHLDSNGSAVKSWQSCKQM